MQSRPMRAVRQDDVARLRHARCGRHVSRARAATLRVRDQPGPTGAVVPAGPAADLAVTAPPRSEASVGPAGPVVPASTLFDGVDALPIRPPSLWAQWRAGWSRRHTVVTGLLTPAVFAGYVAAMGTGPDGWLATVVVLLAAALAATTIARRPGGDDDRPLPAGRGSAGARPALVMRGRGRRLRPARPRPAVHPRAWAREGGRRSGGHSPRPGAAGARRRCLPGVAARARCRRAPVRVTAPTAPAP